jgi:hypothetical protein
MGEFAASFSGFPAGRPMPMEASATLALPAADAYALEPAYAPPAQPPAQPPAPNYAGGYPPFEQLQAPYPPDGGDASLNAPTHAPPPTMGSMPGSGGRTPSWKAAPIVVGIAAVLLLGGAIATWFLIGQSDPEMPGPAASTSASGAPPPAATDTGVAVTPPPSDTAAAADVGHAGAAEAGAAAPEGVPVKITCSPEACETIVIDDKPVANFGDDLRLAPGKHKVTVRRTGFFPQTEAIEVEAGKPFEKDYALRATAATTTTATGRPPKRDCSKLKLLERKRCERGQ